jgi:hypothetical protein
MDILTLKLANRYTDSRLRMTVTIADKHIFSSEAARDAYFASNPGELEEGLYVQAGTQFFRYHDEEWVEVTAIVRGPKGEKGDPGEKGEKGEKGDPGEKGEKGDKGDPGEKGEKGDKGDPPAHEWQGAALRFENPDGSWGQFVDLRGEKGDRGEKGEKGDQGEKGEKGDQGEKGEKGEKGDQGEKGEKGDKGDPGEKGEKGDKGDKGDPPAHEWQGTALSFENPDGSWGQLVDLRGEKGDQGEKGEKGEKGDPGEKGEKGDKGDPGEKGEKGDKGDPPAHEWQGTTLRFENPDGSWGQFVNLKGEKGDKGDRGEKGEKGDKGDQGEKGEKGDKGDKGDTGPMPDHEWQGTALRFQEPDGTWPSTWVDLKGEPAYHATLTATLDTDGWTGTEAPFAQIQEVSGILATDVPIVDVVLSGDWEVDEARLEAWRYIYRIVTSNDSITAYAREKPEVALPIQLKVVRGIGHLLVEEGEPLDE